MTEEYTRRDNLAQDRTHLANERTLLSYYRTALALIISGAVLIKFLPSIYPMVGGVVSILSGVGLFIFGTLRYLNWRKRIDRK